MHPTANKHTKVWRLPNGRIWPENMRISGKTDIPTAAAAIAFSKTHNSSASDSDLLSSHGSRKKKTPRRRAKTRGFSAFGVRLKSGGTDGTPAARRSTPETPLLTWKFDAKEDGYASSSVKGGDEKLSPPESARKSRRKVSRVPEVVVSARRLAAALWSLRSPPLPASGGGSVRRSLGIQPSVGHEAASFIYHGHKKTYNSEANAPLKNTLSFSGPENGLFCEQFEPSFQFPNSTMEGATKWDLVHTKASDEARGFLSQLKLFDRQVSDVSLISVFESKLGLAHAQIQKLETERVSSKKKLGHFLKKLNEERANWRSREHEKIRAVIDDVKADINRERKKCHRMELVNSKLVCDLANVKISAKQVRQDYENERKSRELIEEVCDELANEIRNDKAELEALKRGSMKLLEEVEGERRMLQMAEVWREECVQMKLIDAKVVLDEKHSHISKLIADMQDFLRSTNAIPDETRVREAKLRLQAATSENIQNIEFSYEPRNPDDVFAVFEDINLGEANKKDLETHVTQSTASGASEVHTVSPEVSLVVHSDRRHFNAFAEQNADMDGDESGWETVSPPLDGSSYSPDGSSDLSVPRIHPNSNISESRTEWEGNAGEETHITEMSNDCAVQSSQSKKSSVTKFWKSCPNGGENFPKIPVQGTKEMLSKGRISNGSNISPYHGSVEARLSPSDLVAQWSSPDSSNPNTNRVTKGCIEWPRSMQKYILKTKLLEAKIESQKIQLRHVLRQKS